ncbi:MAG TPA: tetratricopeptide repeat protein, partial [Chitinophagaceae bacterium]|nr:tetratricopeptide repeat protein [Chitinophagaceae bacterium]
PYHLFLLAIGLIAALYFGGNRKAPDKAAVAQQPAEKGAETMGPAAEAIDFMAYTRSAKERLNATDRKKLEDLETKASGEKDVLPVKDLAEFWESKNELNMAASYYKKAAFLENKEKSLTFAGNLLLALMQKTDEAPVRVWQAREAIPCFLKALEMNPQNADLKVALATCYTEGTGETMKGVMLLREVSQADSNHVNANMMLGKLAIQSGQFDKAIARLERVLSRNPKNSEALYFLAEAYKGKGNISRAVSLFEECKQLVNNPDFSKEIDRYINSFK